MQRFPIHRLGALALLTLAVACNRHREPAPGVTAHPSEHAAPCFQHGATAPREFEFELRTGTQIHHSDQSTSEVRGVASLAASAHGADWLLQLAFRPGASATGEENPLARVVAEQPCLVLLHEGRVRATRVFEGQSSESIGWCRWLGAMLQDAVGSSATATSWEATDFDSTGRYVARYQVVPGGSLEKSKLRYETLTIEERSASGASAKSRALPKVLSSKGVLNCPSGKLQSLAYDESLEMAIGPNATAQVTTHLALSPLADAGKVQAVAWEKTLAVTTPLAMDAPLHFQRDPELSFDDARRAGWTFERALEAIQHEPGAPALVAHGSAADSQEASIGKLNSAAFQAMKAILRAEPERIPDVVTLIRQEKSGASSLVSLLSASGTPAAQQALLGLITDKGRKNSERARVVQSLLQVKRPTAALLTMLERCAPEPALGPSCLYVLGSLGRHAREAGDRAGAELAWSVLKTALTRATSDTERENLLGALGNLGAPGTAGLVVGQLLAKSPSVRAQAVSALRLTPDVERLAALLTALKDESSDVRLAAVQALAAQPLTTGAVEVLVKLAKTETVAMVRKRAEELVQRSLSGSPAGGGTGDPARSH